MKALHQLREYTRSFAERCSQARWGRAAFHVGVQTHLIADAQKTQVVLRDVAYSAEQSDLEAIKTLEAATADGLSNSDMEAVAKAIRLIRRSADKDHKISDALTT